MIRRLIPLTPRGWRFVGYAIMALIGAALFGALRAGLI